MNSGHTRIRRVAVDLGLARAGAPGRTAHSHGPAGAAAHIAADQSAALALLSGILTGEETWSVGEMRRLLELKERGHSGMAG